LNGACKWLAEGLAARTGQPLEMYPVLESVSAASPIGALVDHEVDVALTTPIAAAGMAFEGRGPFVSAHRGLRAIGVLPHRDRLGLVVGRDVARRYGLRTVGDVIARRVPLRIISAPNDGISLEGFAARELLRRFGVSWNDLLSWGGQLLPYRGLQDAAAQLISGAADGMIHHSIMEWCQFSEARPMRLLAIDEGVLDGLRDAFGIGSATVLDGEHEGVDGGGRVLDWSQWIICCRTDLAEQVGHALAATLVEDRAGIETEYRATSIQRSLLRYPIEASGASKTSPMLLHCGAAAYFAQLEKYQPRRE
jgi:hypothetical protein